MNEKWFPRVDFSLPITEIKIEVSRYLTYGQTKDLQKMLLETDVKLSTNEEKMKENIESSGSKAIRFLEISNKLFEFLFVSASSNGEKIEVENASDFLDKLPAPDAMVVRDKCTDIMNTSSLTDNSKKK